MDPYKVLLSSVLIVASAFSANASGTSGVEWLGQTHDFGAFHEEMGTVNTSFRFINTGDSPIYILYARANCGCTTPRYSRDPVAPGDTAVVSVGFNPTGRVGKFEKYIVVDTGTGDDGERTRSKLVIHGTVIGSSNTISGRYPVDAGPLKFKSSAAALGQVLKGKLASASLSGYNRGNDSISPSVEGLPEYLTATVRPEKVAPGENVSILISMDSRKCDKWGIVTDNITIVADTAKRDFSTVAIIMEDFSSLTPEELAQSPSINMDDRIAAGAISRAGGEKRYTVAVTNRGKSPLMLRRVYTTEPGIAAYAEKSEIAPGETSNIVVIIDPSELSKQSDKLGGRILIITNDPSEPQAVLKVEGIVED